MPDSITLGDILNSRDDSIFDVATRANGPQGCLDLYEANLWIIPAVISLG